MSVYPNWDDIWLLIAIGFYLDDQNSSKNLWMIIIKAENRHIFISLSEIIDNQQYWCPEVYLWCSVIDCGKCVRFAPMHKAFYFWMSNFFCNTVLFSPNDKYGYKIHFRLYWQFFFISAEPEVTTVVSIKHTMCFHKWRL